MICSKPFKTGDVFTARFADFHFNEAIFPPLGGEKKTQKKDVSLSEPSLLYLDPRTKQSETKVQKIMHLQEIANQLPDAFTDTKRVTKSHIRAVNTPARVELYQKPSRYLISLAVSRNLEMRLMDVVTAYLYGSIDNDIYMKNLEGFKIPESLSSKPKEIKGYKSNLIFPCVFIKKTTCGFVIIAVYVDDLNIIGTNKEINEVVMHLKEEFEMKDLAISMRRSQKQTLVATSSNHAEVIALHEASRECVGLRSITQLIVTSCGLNIEKSPTIIQEDNAACVAQMKEGYQQNVT
ncbi:hypothetical protein Tco_0415821 [Tanacetum coccineum]